MTDYLTEHMPDTLRMHARHRSVAHSVSHGGDTLVSHVVVPAFLFKNKASAGVGIRAGPAENLKTGVAVMPKAPLQFLPAIAKVV